MNRPPPQKKERERVRGRKYKAKAKTLHGFLTSERQNSKDDPRDFQHLVIPSNTHLTVDVKAEHRCNKYGYPT